MYPGALEYMTIAIGNGALEKNVPLDGWGLLANFGWLAAGPLAYLGVETPPGHDDHAGPLLNCKARLYSAEGVLLKVLRTESIFLPS